MANHRKIVVLGAGFAGLRCAKILSSFFPNQVTLIDKNNYHLYTPLLYELDERKVKLPIKTRAQFIRREVQDWRDLDYDYLVLATGAETNYYNIPGLEENTLVFKDLGDIEKLRKILPGKILIIGGGVTGVELAAALAIKLEGERIRIIESCSQVLSDLDSAFREKAEARLKKFGVGILTNHHLIKVEKNRVFFKNNEVLEYDNLIWTGGVSLGKYKVDKYLRLAGEKNIFAIGDCSSANPGLIHPALEQARIAAENIKRSINGMPLLPYSPRIWGIIVPLGGCYALAEIGKIKIAGFVAWLIKKIINFMYKKTYV